jgi:DNA-binding transcriptional MerR regulator
MDKPPFQIGALSRATDIKVVTIRFYETAGLLPKPSRSAGNYRTYSQEHLDRLLFIRRCRELGFTLDQVRELLELADQPGRDCCEVDRIAVEHLGVIADRIASLQSLADELRRLSTQCQAGSVIADCRIISALSSSRELGKAPKKKARTQHKAH